MQRIQVLSNKSRSIVILGDQIKVGIKDLIQCRKQPVINKTKSGINSNCMLRQLQTSDQWLLAMSALISAAS